MIYLFTDFGHTGPYIGELRAALLHKNPQSPVVDLMHDVPVYLADYGAILLAALAKRFRPNDACLAIVDPGVGHAQRRPLLVEADGVIFCGPDNGLLNPVIQRATDCRVSEILWRPDHLSDSFHGRDLFAPALMRFLAGEELACKALDFAELAQKDRAEALAEVIYIDRFGNGITGLDANRLQPNQILLVCGQAVTYARTFSEVVEGTIFWYKNSMGLVEIACNQGNAAQQLGMTLSTRVEFKS